MTKINWNPSNKELQKFGLTLIVGFGLIGLLLFFRGKHLISYGLWGGASAICLIAFIRPEASKLFYWIWMAFGFVLGAIMSRVVMSLIFLAVLTPVALIFRFMNRDALRLKKVNDKETSYWQAHPVVEKSSYDHLF